MPEELPPVRKICDTCNQEWFYQPAYEWQARFSPLHERCPQCKAQKVIDLPGWGFVIFQTYTAIGDIRIYKPDPSWGGRPAAIELPGGEMMPAFTAEEMQKFIFALSEAVEYAKKLDEAYQASRSQ